MSSSAKERAVQIYLAGTLQRDYEMINFTPIKWWECDYFSILKSGYTEEHEIKMTLSDYRADFKKSKFLSVSFGENYMASKHSMLDGNHRNCPNRFWFCVADEIADKIEVPEYAGLKVFEMSKEFVNSAGVKVPVGVLDIKTVKPAPLIHREKASRELIDDLIKTGYYRYRYSWDK